MTTSVSVPWLFPGSRQVMVIVFVPTESEILATDHEPSPAVEAFPLPPALFDQRHVDVPVASVEVPATPIVLDVPASYVALLVGFVIVTIGAVLSRSVLLEFMNTCSAASTTRSLSTAHRPE